MMRSEFIERTGFDPTADEYAEIEQQYMDSDMDKDKWCAKWKRDGGIVKYTNQRKHAISDLSYKLDESNRKLEKLEQAREYDVKVMSEYKDEINLLKKKLMELEYDRDTYRNKLQAIKDALTF